MRFTARFLAISAALSQVLALPVLTDPSYVVTEGKAFDITWTNATGAVTLTLKNGASTDLGTVSTIASGLTGTSYSWTPSSLPSDTYAIAITDSTGTNYSPQFSYQGTGTATTTTTSASAKTTASTVTTDSTTTTSAGTSSVTSAKSSATGSSNSTSTASSTLSTATSKATSTSSSSSSSSSSTPVNTNDSKKLGSSLAFVILTAAALLVCH